VSWLAVHADSANNRQGGGVAGVAGGLPVRDRHFFGAGLQY